MLYSPSKVRQIAIVCCILEGISLCKLRSALIFVGMFALLLDLHNSFSEYSFVFPLLRVFLRLLSDPVVT